MVSIPIPITVERTTASEKKQNGRWTLIEGSVRAGKTDKVEVFSIIIQSKLLVGNLEQLYNCRLIARAQPCDLVAFNWSRPTHPDLVLRPVEENVDFVAQPPALRIRSPGTPPAKALGAVAPRVEWAENKLVLIPELAKTSFIQRAAVDASIELWGDFRPVFKGPWRLFLRSLESANSTLESLTEMEEKSMAANSETLHNEVRANIVVNLNESCLRDKSGLGPN